MKTPSEEYTEAETKAAYHMMRIQSAIATQSAEHSDWGDAGFMAHIAEQLKNIADQMNGTGEYSIQEGVAV